MGQGFAQRAYAKQFIEDPGNIRGAAVTQVSSAPPPAARQSRSRRSAPESFVPANNEGYVSIRGSVALIGQDWTLYAP